TDIRSATHHILFTVANSNAMNGLAPGATVSYTPPTWVYLQIGGSVLLGLLVLAGTLMVTRRVRRYRGAVPAGPEAEEEITTSR
ncbi:MAG TPA: hypothetical protein VGC67_02175, partial [Cellulomonas sp.]